MNSYSLQLPDELMVEVRRLAEAQQIPIDQWLREAIAKKVEAEAKLQLLKRYAARADYDRFDHIMARVPAIDPLPNDQII